MTNSEKERIRRIAAVIATVAAAAITFYQRDEAPDTVARVAAGMVFLASSGLLLWNAIAEMRRPRCLVDAELGDWQPLRHGASFLLSSGIFCLWYLSLQWL